MDVIYPKGKGFGYPRSVLRQLNLHKHHVRVEQFEVLLMSCMVLSYKGAWKIPRV